jgi:hypothetical protein
MDALQRVEHRHGDTWHAMEAEDAAADASSSDRERSWALGRIFRCTTCDDAIRVIPPESEPHPEVRR